MKFLLYFRQVLNLLIAFLFLDTIALTVLFLLDSSKKLISHPLFWGPLILLFLPILFALGQILSQLASRKLLIWSAVVYVLYSGFSYLLAVTQNINNYSFKAANLLKNDFFQLHSLPYLLLLFGAAYAIKQLPAFKKIRASKLFALDSYSKDFLENLFLAELLLFFVLTDNQILELFRRQVWLSSFFGGEAVNGDTEWLLPLICFSLLLILLASLPSYWAVKGMRDMTQNKGSFSAAFLASAAFAVIFNYTLQNSIRADISVLEHYLFTGASFFQIAIFFVFFLFIYLAFNRFFLPTILITVIGTAASIASSLKFQYRQEPVLPSDIVWLRNPKTLLDFLDGSYGLYVLLAILAIGAAYWFLRKKIMPEKLVPSIKYQLILLALPVAFFIGVLDIFSSKEDGKIADNIPVLSILTNYHDLTWFGNTVNSQMRSLSFVWFSQLSDSAMTQPKGYSKERMEELEEKYRELAASINEKRQHKIEDQTVVYVLSESFADPARIEGVSMSENPIPKIQEIMSQTTSGLMKSDGYGGGTANMEFQTLTGLPFYNLSPSISVIYTEVVPRMNKFPSISDSFAEKNRYAIHLASPSNYSRNIIYKDLGFDTFIHYGTKGLKGDNIGGNYSDRTTYNQVLDNLDSKQSQFFSVMTMQNHMPWTEVNPVYMSASYPGFSKAANASLSSYVRMLYHTDGATKDFLDKLSQLDKKITVVFYGDHLPGLYPQSAFKDHPENQYLTDYFIWSNYETPKLDYPLVNSSDFSALLLEQTDSKVSPYYALLTEILHKASVDKSDLNDEARDIADDLKLVEFDIVGGRGYLSKDFFKQEENKK